MTREERIQEARDELRKPIEDPPDESWWCVCGNLATLFDWLIYHGEMTMDQEEIRYFLSKPWKWTDEWNQMQAEKAKQ